MYLSVNASIWSTNFCLSENKLLKKNININNVLSLLILSFQIPIFKVHLIKLCLTSLNDSASLINSSPVSAHQIQGFSGIRNILKGLTLGPRA